MGCDSCDRRATLLPSVIHPVYPADRYHKSALMATCNFWRMLRKDQVSLVQLSDAFRKIDFMEVMADKTYKLVLEKYVATPCAPGIIVMHG